MSFRASRPWSTASATTRIGNSRSASTASPRRCARRGSRSMTVSPSSARIFPRCSRRTTVSRSPAGCSSPSTSGSRPTRSATSSSTRDRRRSSWTPSSSTWSSRWTSQASGSCAWTIRGRPAIPTRISSPPAPTLLSKLKELNFRPVHVYGLTETYGPHTVCAWHKEWDALPADEQATLAARQGQGYALFDLVRVVDGEMNDVPRDGETLGEVIMIGNNCAMGYFDQPDATAEAFRGGWFHSGDIGVWHPDGYVELRDRKKDIIISGGENISTIEVEQCVAKHPAVMECAVVAVPDEKWGERPKAFVMLKPGMKATETEIIDHCRTVIAHFKCPAAVEFGDLPKTSTGKVQKFVLRNKEWAGKTKRIN